MSIDFSVDSYSFAGTHCACTDKKLSCRRETARRFVSFRNFVKLVLISHDTLASSECGLATAVCETVATVIPGPD